MSLEARDAYQVDSTVIVCFTEDLGYCLRLVKVTLNWTDRSKDQWVLTWQEGRKDATALLTLAGTRDDLALVARIWVINGKATL